MRKMSFRYKYTSSSAGKNDIERANERFVRFETQFDRFIQHISDSKLIRTQLYDKVDCACTFELTDVYRARNKLQLDDLSVEKLQEYILLCKKYDAYHQELKEAIFRVMVQDRGWPRRACHTVWMLSQRQEEFHPAKYFNQWGIEERLVRRARERHNWVYEPDLNEDGLYIALAWYPKLIHISYNPYDTVRRVVDKVIDQCEEISSFEVFIRIGNKSLSDKDILLVLGIRNGTILLLDRND